jgi:hypothetical protein
MKRRIAIGMFALVVVGLVVGYGRSATRTVDQSLWGAPISAWHLPARGPNRIEVADRQVGVGSYVDDTKVVTYVDVNGNVETTHSSRWHVADLSRLGVPRNAKAVRLSLKGIITKGSSDGLATVYVMIRPFGSKCCAGPPGNRDYPVDFQMADRRQVESVLQTVAQHAVDGLREWATVDVPLKGAKFEWAWGYRRVPSDWPSGDGVAFEMFANGYGT